MGNRQRPEFGGCVDASMCLMGEGVAAEEAAKRRREQDKGRLGTCDILL